ncbi:hypothetical protein [Polaromonas sp.]|uniref:hypothetical protein n=1 Tax=Polaromonas sp. TaxID=1869339 RepID=UPI00352A2580
MRRVLVAVDARLRYACQEAVGMGAQVTRLVVPSGLRLFNRARFCGFVLYSSAGVTAREAGLMRGPFFLHVIGLPQSGVPAAPAGLLQVRAVALIPFGTACGRLPSP